MIVFIQMVNSAKMLLDLSMNYKVRKKKSILWFIFQLFNED